MNYPSDILMHYGTKRHSGRYPWGSGEDPYQHEGDFLSRVDELRAKNFTYVDENGKEWTGDTAIAKYMGMTTTEFRTQVKLEGIERHKLEVEQCQSLKAKGYGPSKISEMTGIPESTVRSYLNGKSEVRMSQAQVTANYLKEQVEKKGMIDVGAGVERDLGVSKEMLKASLYILEQDGYKVYGGRIDQVTNPNSNQKTTIKVLCPPDAKKSDIYDTGEIHSATDYISYDNGASFRKAFEYPSSMDSSRLQICYAEDGGKDKDGLIEIRRGVEDLSLGESHYAQVRILVDETHYIKGMAVYSDDLPEGVDVRFNTNKTSDVSKMDVLKKIKDDPDNPFGSLIKEHGGQSYYDDPNGKYTDPVTGNKQSLSLINKRSDESDWNSWDDKLSSQFLSKQPIKLINRQLNEAIDDKVQEYNDICSCTNPTVKKVLLASFASDCDSAAVHLKAAALPRQKYQVILPLTDIKDNEIYAPNYNDGETVALIRYPHGGTFEIPILKVNNKNAEGTKVLGPNAKDAVGINSTVAAQLSGADFDGDTVLVIPCNSSSSDIYIHADRPLDGLKDFDPKLEYGAKSSSTDSDGNDHYYDGNGYEYKAMKNTQTEMGIISNLITDMTLQGADEEELVRAVRHSMVVIDAEKHHLNYQQSYKDNDIDSLKKKYQAHVDDDGKVRYGAATLISRASAETRIDKRQGTPKIDPETGKLIYKTADDLEYSVAKIVRGKSNEPNATIRVSKKGKNYIQFDGSDEWISLASKTKLSDGSRVAATLETKKRQETSTQMADTDDAYTLSSGTKTEAAYAEYANKMKAMANEARKEMVSTGKIEYSASARATYQNEVNSLDAKLNEALKNAPRERQAQFAANAKIKAMKEDNPNMSTKEIKKKSQQALTEARIAVGASRKSIEITDKEWEAIQSGAISEKKLMDILNNTDIDAVKARAIPRESTKLSDYQINRIKSYSASGLTNAQIAEALGISVSTVRKYLS